MVSEWVELNNGMRMLKVRIPDSRPPEVRKMLGYANTLRGLLKFVRPHPLFCVEHKLAFRL